MYKLNGTVEGFEKLRISEGKRGTFSSKEGCKVPVAKATKPKKTGELSENTKQKIERAQEAARLFEQKFPKETNKSPTRKLAYVGDDPIEKEIAFKKRDKIKEQKVDARRKHKFMIIHKWVAQSGYLKSSHTPTANSGCASTQSPNSLCADSEVGLEDFEDNPITGLTIDMYMPEDATPKEKEVVTIELDHQITESESLEIGAKIGTLVKLGYTLNEAFERLGINMVPQVGFSSFLPSVPSLMKVDSTISLDEPALNLINNLNTNLLSATDKLSNISLTVEAGDSVKAMGGTLTDIGAVVLICAIVLIYRPTTRQEKIALAMLVFGYVASRGGLKSILDMSGLSSWLSSDVVPQSGMDSFEEASVVVSGLLSAYVCNQSGKQLFNAKELARVVGVCGKMKMGVKSITDAASIIMRYIHSSIESWYSGSPFFVKSGYEFIDAFRREATEILDLAEQKQLAMIQSSLSRVKACIELGDSVILKIPGTHDFSMLRMQLINVMAELRKVKSSLLQSGFMHAGIRQEPTVILLIGSPGVGKSQAMQHLGHAINALTLDDKLFAAYKENPGSQTYNRQAENVFWELYRPDMNIVYMDDLGQAREVAGSPDNETMNLIRMANVFENQLHVAAIEGKGCTTFRSNFVIANTNKRNFESESIHDQGAFLRRFDLVVEVVPKDKYCIDASLPLADRRFDPALLPRFGPGDADYANPKYAHLLGMTKINPDMCDYHVLKMERGKTQFFSAGEVISFAEVVHRYHDRYLTKKKYYDMYLKDLDETMERYREVHAEMQDVEPQIGGTTNAPAAVQQQSRMRGGFDLDDDRKVILMNMRYDDGKKYVFFCTVFSWLIIRVQCRGYQALHSELFDLLKTMLFEDNFDWDHYETVDAVVERVVGIYIDSQPQYLKKWPKLRNDFTKVRDWYDSTFRDETNPTWVTRIYEVYRVVYAHSLMTLNNVAEGYVATAENFLTAPLSSKLSFLYLNGVAIMGVYKLIRFFGSTVLNAFPDSDERRTHNAKVRIPRRTPARAKAGVTYEAHSVARVNENMTAIIRKVCNSNVFEIKFPTRDSGVLDHEKMGYCIGIQGRTVMLPYHFVDMLQHEFNEGNVLADDLVMLLRPATQYRDFNISVSDFLGCFKHLDSAEKQDIAMVKFPKNFNPVPDIRKYFATDKSMQLYKRFDSVLVIPSSVPKGSENWKVSEFHSIVSELQHDPTISGRGFEPYNISDIFVYSAHTTSGDCGSFLCVNDRSTSSPLVGIHVAGSTNTKTGMSSRVSREMIQEYLDLLEEDYEVVDNLKLELAPPESSPDNMVNLGEFTPQVKHPSVHGKTKIARSALYGLVDEVKRAPARLAPFTQPDGTRVDPMEKAIAKYCREDTYIDPQTVNAAVIALFDDLEAKSPHNVDRVMLDFEHAVLGDSDGDFAAVPRTTSAGYPYSVMTGNGTKARFFGLNDVYDFTNSECQKLMTEVAMTIELAKTGKRLTHYFTDFPKDERRSLKKVLAGETRLISGCPTPLLIAMRQLFGSFQKWLIRNKIRNGLAIGINEYSSDWDVLARVLNEFGDGSNKGAGDYQGFDMGHQNAVAWAILRAINAWYNDGPEMQRARATLWEEVVNSLHLNSSVFQWKRPLPSGCPLTTMFNCLSNLTYFRVCWIKIMHPTERYAHDFNKMVKMIVMGDDNAFAVHPSVLHQFNEISISKAMAEIGQIYTPENKENTEFTLSMRTLEEVGFLKRRFYRHPKAGRYMAPLEIDAITDIINWTSKGVDARSIEENNAQIFLEEFSLHPRPIFEIWKGKLLEAVRKIDGFSPPPITDYDALFRNVLVRERFSDGEQRFLTGYDDLIYKIPGQEIQGGRFEEKKGGLFKLTSRTPCWQPQSSPGNPGEPHRLVRRGGNICTAANEPLGLTNDGTMETQRLAEIPSQSEGTTHSNVEAETPITMMKSYVPLTRDVLDSACTTTTQDIRDFLAKPVVINTGTLTMGDTYATFKWSSIIPGQLLYGVDMWKRKLEGIFAFRGELHLTVQVNATRMQQGRYILGWVPSGGAVNEQKWTNMHLASLAQATQVPHVEIDVNCDTEATLIIPFVNAQGWAIFDNSGGATNYGNVGRVFFTAYSPLQVATGSASAGFSIMAHWEKVELAMPVNPQSGRGVRSSIKRRSHPSSAEQDSQNIGPISSALSRISTTASLLSGVPLLSSVATQVAWAAEVASRSAKSFGWSKPHNAEHAQLMQRSIAAKFTNCDTADNSTKLGYTDANEVEDLPGFAGSNLDEMSLNYVASISSWWKTVTWDSASAVNTVILTQEISPRAWYSQTTTNTKILTHMCPVTMVSNFFALYRGSHKITVKIAKTEFHTGRLMLSFFPQEYNANGGYPLGSVAQSGFVHREIIDVREGNEFSFIIPYMSVTPYRSCAGFDSITGRILLSVLNPLVAPAVVPSTVPLMIEISAGPDFEWAQPADPLYPRITQTFVPQVGGRNDCEIVTGVLGNATLHNSNTARLCAGERILSFRSLVKRFNEILHRSPNTPATFLQFNPFQADIAFVDTTTAYSDSIYDPDMYTWLISMFALSRGAVRLKVIQRQPLTTCLPQAFAVPSNGTLPADNFTFNATVSLPVQTGFAPTRAQALFREENGGVEIEFPYYSRTHSSASADLLYNSSTGNAIKTSPQGVTTRSLGYVWYETTPASTPRIYRAAGEDFSVGLFVSVPPVNGYQNNYMA